MTVQIPIGIDDFRALREAGLEYVDKSLNTTSPSMRATRTAISARSWTSAGPSSLRA